jgi:hypothetical protein
MCAAISRVFAGMWSVVSAAYPRSPSPPPAPPSPTLPEPSEQITDRPGASPRSTPVGAGQATQITSSPGSPQAQIVSAAAIEKPAAPLTDPAELRRQLRLCCLTSVAIAVTAYICAWLTWGRFDTIAFSQSSTREYLRVLNRQIVRYKERTGHLPVSLMELPEDKEASVRRDEDGLPVDGWMTPLHYEVNGDSYDLYSLGEDDAPGGSGLDADLHAGSSNPWNEWITLWQFSKSLATAASSWPVSRPA